MTIAGQDFPLSRLNSLRIDTSGLSLRLGQSAEFSQTYNDRHELIHFSADLGVCAELTPALIPPYYLGTGIFLITAAPPEQQRATLDWLVTHGFSGRVAIDTALSYIQGFRLLLAEHYSTLDFVFFNLQEYTLLGWQPPSRTTLVIKRGADGATLRECGVWLNLPAPHVERVQSTTGAGDILAGAYLAGLALGDSSVEALLKAIRMASKSVQSHNVEEVLVEGTFD